MNEVMMLVKRASKDFMREFSSFKSAESTISLSDLELIRSFFSDLKTSVMHKTSELKIINNIEAALVLHLVENHSRKKPLKTTNFILNSMVEFNKKLSGLRYEYNSKL